ncbi:MAG: hypothetical protein FWE36_08450 [Erysipelotrichales bacterium]|nr:hypothetical protein [Erysipelotrichales bacterium]
MKKINLLFLSFICFFLLSACNQTDDDWKRVASISYSSVCGRNSTHNTQVVLHMINVNFMTERAFLEAEKKYESLGLLNQMHLIHVSGVFIRTPITPLNNDRTHLFQHLEIGKTYLGFSITGALSDRFEFFSFEVYEIEIRYLYIKLPSDREISIRNHRFHYTRAVTEFTITYFI